MRIILCGLPGCGKTTVGQLLAKKQATHFTDVDRLIESLYAETDGQFLTCRQIYQREGELMFRKLEIQAIDSLRTLSDTAVIAIGGGSLNNMNNVLLLKQVGVLIYLRVDQEIVWERLITKGIPAYLSIEHPKRDFDRLVEERVSIYESFSDACLDIARMTPEEVVFNILKWREENNGE